MQSIATKKKRAVTTSILGSELSKELGWETKVPHSTTHPAGHERSHASRAHKLRDAAADDSEARARGDGEHDVADDEEGLETTALAAESEDAAGRYGGADALPAPAQSGKGGNHGFAHHAERQ